MNILVLMHQDLIPPENLIYSEIDRDSSLWLSEFDVTHSLEKQGNAVYQLGVGSDLGEIRNTISDFEPEIVFNLLEEFDGEAIFDQNVVSYLELLKVPYTGCNPRGLILARDKALSKKILNYHRILTPKFHVFPKNKKNKEIQKMDSSYIVKCLTEEASLGISKASITTTPEKMLSRAEFIHKKYQVDAIAEEFIEGREFYVGVMGNYNLKVFPVWELFFEDVENSDSEIYSSNAKFSPQYRKKKGIRTGPAEISSELANKIKKIANKTYKVLNLNGYARIDFRVTTDEKIYVLEANPNPDISMFDDFASSAKKDGVPYDQLIKKIIDLGKKWNSTT